MPLDPQAAAVLEPLAAGDGPALHEMSPADARVFYQNMAPPLPVEDVAKAEDRTIPGPAGDLPVRVYTPEGLTGGGAPGIVFFHGGGWVIGDLGTHDAICRALANRAQAVVVAIDYRLAPEARYPAAAEDCYAATRWVAENGAEIGVDGSRIAVAGDSAGGNLSAVVALMARDRGGPALRFQFLIYPVTDCDFDTASYAENGSGYLLERDSMQWFWNHYEPDETTRKEPYASPLHAESLANLPPAFVVTAEYDPLRDEGEAYAKRLEEAGVQVERQRYDGMIHGFVQLIQIFDQGKVATDRAGALLRAALA